MIHSSVINPQSIVVVGASNDITKPGGKVIKNILDHHFAGNLYAVNPKETAVQGCKSFASCSDLPQVDLAIIAIPASLVEAVMQQLANEKNCKGFIIFSAGFGEIGDDGKQIEQRCAAIADAVGGTLIGPNCIGVLTTAYKGVFAGPIPKFDLKGCDIVSASGATLVFILEEAIRRGISFSNIFSVGNSAQTGVEEILQHWDETFDTAKSSHVKLIYMEEISNPQKFLKHARSLVTKGCRIAAIKAGRTDAGQRAVLSHTGSLASSDSAVSALFRKAGIVRCYSRVELVYVAGILTYPPLKGNRIAVITHAGGPGVMLTDTLTKGGMLVPKMEGEKAEELKSKLFHGASVSNPIDFLATGTAAQLGTILDYVDNEFENIDASVVVFGTTGMWSVNNVYEMLHDKMSSCSKPIYPILPSVIQAADEVSHFQSRGRTNFTDEVSFAYTLGRVYKTHLPFAVPVLPKIDVKAVRSVIEKNKSGFLNPQQVEALLSAAGINCAKQFVVKNLQQAIQQAAKISFPLVMKVVGPVHKTEVNGVMIGIKNNDAVVDAFNTLMKLKDATAVLMQPMISGTEIFIGAKKEDGFGHLILVGLGGIFVEAFKDVSSGLSPLGMEEALSMIHHLKSYPLIKGMRGKQGVNENKIAEVMQKLSALLQAAPEILELDINPLMGNGDELIAVDARVLL